MFFDDFFGLLRVAVISLAAYITLIIVLRAAGKRALAKLNAFDLVVTVALGSTLATVLLSSDVAFLEGASAFAMLALLQWIVSKASVRFSLVRRLTRSTPAILMIDGEMIASAMRAERVTHEEVMAAIRGQGIARTDDVAAVVLECDGSLSAIRRPRDGNIDVLGFARD